MAPLYDQMIKYATTIRAGTGKTRFGMGRLPLHGTAAAAPPEAR